MNNLSVPAFFFEVAVDSEGIERNQVVDGQQRLTTLKQFYDRKFRLVESGDAPYISPNSVHYAGKTFDELPTVYQQSFQKYRLAIIKLRDLKDMRLEVFRRINQGGTPLSGQDIRLAYYGENSPSLAFIRLAGIYDKSRQAAQRFIRIAEEKYSIKHPWNDLNALENWQDLWAEKDVSRGQTASEMFLWSLMAAQHSQLDAILQNGDALRKLNVAYNREIDGAMDVYCAQLRYQDAPSTIPPALMPLESMSKQFFPHFQSFFNAITSFGPSIDVRKYRTIASLIGACYRSGTVNANWSRDQWGRAVEFIRRPTDSVNMFGVLWPQSKGRWDGAKGYRAQMEAAETIAKQI
ncbi:MAG: DUF262 domain-containing protein [Hyphomicrobiaceae bacterium]|nr:DUF262 domain-containing protein [Hyphomicrobiaceae bacterium]